MPDEKPYPFRIEFPPDLPISARAGEIVDALQEHPVLILAGETGSGKTTQIPKLCLAAGRGLKGRIACTQPRRVAALSVSKRVAEEMGVRYGREVGCKVRFSDQTTKQTVVKFMTDGMLLAEVQSDPMLREYDTVIIDEAHERSLNIDFLLGHLRQLRHRRPDLRIVITSATIDTAAFSQAFDDAPIIEVSGRTYPVEVVYAPLDELGSDAAEGDAPTTRSEALHYVDGAVEAAKRILDTTSTGDVLVFMPAERDIRETIDLLGGSARGCDLIPLFGRLSNSEQQRVFAATARRRVIVATNIAETSLTLPGIRYVVDTGLSRVSRYSPQARTRRLPIEAVAQSSADQRKGRAGRVAEGVCIRLYSEKDYNERPRFTQPEIQRANLADVILRMKAFGLGDIERFPFLNMPATKSIRAGYALLDELHAMESTGDARTLTAMGRELARLPVDPTVGRMILQAREEKALREVVIIAAGLSVQDPRERPLEKQAEADAAHRRFTHPESDFLTLLEIWEALHDEFEKLSQGRMRRWCKAHFLSYTRMREWRDIHGQLLDTLRDRRDFQPSSVWDGLTQALSRDEAAAKLGFDQPAYRAIHRSILAGLLGNIAARDDEKGGFKATQDRRVNIFPGSGLFVREERKKGRGPKPSAPAKPRGPRWLLAAEIVETARLYARTCARLDPLWALDLGAHLVKVAHSEPFWDEAKGRVMVRQRTRLYGLEIESRAVGYGKIDPEHATELFIREALVNDTITWPFDFLMHNRKVRTELENQMTRTRDRGVMNLDEAIFRFYAEALLEANHVVSAVPELIALVKERRPHEPRFLEFDAETLRDPEALTVDAAAFPESVPLNNEVLPLNYNYKPGEADDGVTLEVDVTGADGLTPAALDWAVPGHLPQKVEHYLRGLPKELRREVMPLAATAKSLVPQLASRDRLTGRRETLPEALAALLGERFSLRISPSVWDERPLPDHLRVRVRVTDDHGTEIVGSRELVEVRAAVEAQKRQASSGIAKEAPGVWKRARCQWETEPLEGWTIGELPDEVTIGETAGVPVQAYPVFDVTREGVAVRLCRTIEDADRRRPAGLRAMLAQALRYDLAWMEKDLRSMRDVGAVASTLAPVAELSADAMAGLTAWITAPERLPSRDGGRTKQRFDVAVEEAKQTLRGLVPRLIDRVREVLALRQELLVHPTPFDGMKADLDALVSPRFLRDISYSQLGHVPRYLRGMQARADRWSRDPVKDAQRAKLIAPYLKAARELQAEPGGESLRWLVEEYRVSIFAQNLGTAEPVSAKKLDHAVATIRGGGRAVATSPTAPAKPPPKPMAVTPLPGKTKQKPLKSLNALDGLFRHPGSR
ncbi:ATP-dependent RNA helicase HrpA [Synoicihabitans lomoniglobus]|uniref:ATP-dependent RNA helicase HrpA n=1 Tax=Synoicihabitans lomoniglobus TaxID=2909285 RepID=A0AAF0I3V6_9BACT|nr:ATP-dependent RNA helicase HrpA [Opitutaceae bacterium LMO-M01]WED66389.1 ATP-dependent RNA helicase HrpA [Opitutaceae bacterium LMO-M01]